MLLDLGLSTALRLDLLHDGKRLLLNRLEAELLDLSVVAHHVVEIFGKLLRSEERELREVGKAEPMVGGRIGPLRAE